MKYTYTLAASLLTVSLAPLALAHKEAPIQPKVQVAILLDTSSSMDGLIDQTKSQLWKVVNTFVDAKKDDQVPFVEVALYEYGNSDLKPGQNFIRQVQPFTRDMDQLSADLFSLVTNGGDEYCGAVIERAMSDLKWDENEATYKAIFIAGNEPFTQGPVLATAACRDASEHGVVINTVHCGSDMDGRSGGWSNGAQLADGSYTVINQDAEVVAVKAPQDKEILDLNARLNSTYVPFGNLGSVRKRSQLQADELSVEMEVSGAAVERAVTKSTLNYSNSSWDLVDASAGRAFDWATVQEQQLPKELRGLTREEKKAYVAGKLAERKAIQESIKKLNEERSAFIADEQVAAAEDGVNTLDEVVTQTVREQAEKKGYTFE